MQVSINHQGNHLEIKLVGILNSETMGNVWRSTMPELESAPKVIVDAAEIEYCDGAGAVLFAEMKRRVRGNFEIRSLKKEFEPMIAMFDVDELAPLPQKKTSASFIENVGMSSAGMWKDLRDQIAFSGELMHALFWAMRHPKRVPWKDIYLIAETTGVNALPIVSLIGFLLGLIMAFQSAIPMSKFGAEIFVADLVGISMLKELGPLMTAIVLAGRSGSAFAAELGTMKVNEEVNALTTMGIDPVRFLAVTRVIAAIWMTPLLAIFCSLSALIGGSIVLLSMGYPLVTYIERIVSAVTISAFLAGVIKSFAFAVLVAGIGCLRGLQTGTGAKAVGDSTTSAVVSGIVLVAIADAWFSIVLYFLGI